jgi:hypothetical protein
MIGDTDPDFLQPENRIDAEMPGVSVMSSQQVRDIFVRVQSANRGSFLTAFTSALLFADSDNFELLKPAAISLIEKYGLDCQKSHKYLIPCPMCGGVRGGITD